MGALFCYLPAVPSPGSISDALTRSATSLLLPARRLDVGEAIHSTFATDVPSASATSAGLPIAMISSPL